MSLSTLFTASRTLTATSPAIPTEEDVPDLVPTRLSGREGINSLFEYRLVLATPDSLNPYAADASNFSLDAFIGEELTVGIELEGSGTFIAGSAGGRSHGNFGAGTREISGLIVHAKKIGERGRQVLHEVTLRPWLHLAAFRCNCRIYQNKSVIEVLDTLLADYDFPVDQFLFETYPKRDHTTQFNETDFAFFSRLCEKWGINYFFEHSEGKHRLVLVDTPGPWKKAASPAYQTLAFYPPGHRIDEEFIEVFEPLRQLTSGRYTTTDYDYTGPMAHLRVSRHDPRPTANGDREVYEFHQDANYVQPRAGAGQVENDPRTEGDLLAMMRMQGLRSPGRRGHGFGHLRGVAPGTRFRLTGHPQDAANTDYVVLQTDFEVEEVGEESRSGQGERPASYRANLHFEVHPFDEFIRPERKTPRPNMSLQTALVVGPKGQNVWTDVLGRIKVQFHWDRYGANDENSSCWVRVAEMWSGNELGATFLPRVGQEVLIGYIDGDIDLPICTARVPNEYNQPPLKLPGNQAVSVIRSREMTPRFGNSACGRSNLLAFDDTDGHIQAQLKSDHQHSQLSLGDITRIEDNTGRKDARGEGFELRTDGHGAVRAKGGLLITAEGRDRAQGAMKDMVETLARLSEAREQHRTLAEAAQQAEAQEKNDKAQTEVTGALEAQNEALKGTAAKFPELAEPHLVLASPAGIEATTSGSTHLHSGEHTAITAGRHLSFSVMGSWFGSVRDKIVFYAQRFGITLTAAKGPVRVEAHRAEIDVIAHRVLNLMSTQDWVRITAKQGVLINGGGSYIKLDQSGIETGTNGRWTVHSASKDLTGPKNLATASRTWTDSLYNDAYVVKHSRTGETLENVRYTITHEDGSVDEGVTDHAGRIPLQRNIDPATLTIRLLGIAH